ncbi:MAG TPA: hypothetical protein VGJ05_01310 [Fimbriiglobus sp.]
MTIGDVLDRGLKVLFTRLPIFYAINVIVLAPAILIQLAIPFVINSGTQADSTIAISFVVLGIVVLVSLILQPIGTAAIVHIIMETYVGRKPGIGQAFSFAFTRFLPLLGASIVVGLIVFVGLIACIAPGVYFAVSYIFVTQVVVLERLSAGEALSRSQKLISGHRGRVFGLIVIIYIVIILVNAVLSIGLEKVLPNQKAVPANGGIRLEINTVNYILDTLISELVQIIFTTYLAVCTTLLYLDVRIRKEGFDIELASQLGEEVRGPRDPEYDIADDLDEDRGVHRRRPPVEDEEPGDDNRSGSQGRDS